MSKKVTMRDIATNMNISVVSVSKAITGKEGVSDDLRSRIIDKAIEMGYEYDNTHALGKEKRGNIGILVAERFYNNAKSNYVNENVFYNDMHKNILARATEFGYNCIIEVVKPFDEKKLILPNMIKQGKIDGIIFMGEIGREYVKKIVELDIPSVLLDFSYEDVNTDSVVGYNMYGSYLLTKHLISRGCKNIRFVGNIKIANSIMDRYLGYYKALLKNDLVSINDVSPIQDRLIDGVYFDVPEFDKLPDAFVCSCDDVAFRYIEALKRRGVKVPEDVSVVGFDNSIFASVSNPKITTYEVDLKRMAFTSICILQKKIEKKSKNVTRTSICGKLIEGDSVINK